MKRIGANRHVHRGSQVSPIREQLIQRPRLHDRPGQDVRPDLRALLDHADTLLNTLRNGQLAEPARGGESRRARADDNDVELHDLSIHTHPQTASAGFHGRGKL